MNPANIILNDLWRYELPGVHNDSDCPEGEVCVEDVCQTDR